MGRVGRSVRNLFPASSSFFFQSEAALPPSGACFKGPQSGGLAISHLGLSQNPTQLEPASLHGSVTIRHLPSGSHRSLSFALSWMPLAKRAPLGGARGKRNLCGELCGGRLPFLLSAWISGNPKTVVCQRTSFRPAVDGHCPRASLLPDRPRVGGPLDGVPQGPPAGTADLREAPGGIPVLLRRPQGAAPTASRPRIGLFQSSSSLT